MSKNDSVTLDYVREKLRPVHDFDLKYMLCELGDYISRNGRCTDEHPTRYTISALIQKAKDMDEVIKLLSR